MDLVTVGFSVLDWEVFLLEMMMIMVGFGMLYWEVLMLGGVTDAVRKVRDEFPVI